MTKDYAYTLNWELLGPPGLLLSDEDYVRVITAMGVPSLRDGQQVERTQHEVHWTVGSFRRALSGLSRRDIRQFADGMIDVWMSRVKHDSKASISLQSGRQWVNTPFPTDVLGVLSHPDVGIAPVWLDWANPQADLKWQWPIRFGAFEDDFTELDLKRLSDKGSNIMLKRTQIISRELARAEVLIIRAEVRRALTRILALKYRVRAVLVLIVAPLNVPWPDLRTYLDALMTETQAAGIAIVQPYQTKQLLDQIYSWVISLSHNTSIDTALGLAFGRDRLLLAMDRRLLDLAKPKRAMQVVASRLKRMPASAKLELPAETPGRINLSWRGHEPVRALAEELSNRLADDDIPFMSESQGASAVAEIETAARSTDRTQATQEGPRYLQGNVYRFSGVKAIKETRGLLLNARHALDMFIGEAGLGAIGAEEPVPDKDIDWGKEESVTLQLILAEPNQWDEPLRGTLKLPRYGRSSTHRFVFSPTRAGPFQGRVTLYYRGRVLQTALLETQVIESAADLATRNDPGPGITLRVEAEVRRSFATLSERRRFDACIVCNHTATRQAAITAMGMNGAYIASLSGLGEAIKNINYLLSPVAQDADRYRTGLRSKANAELLRCLAMEGNALYRRIVKNYIVHSGSAHDIQEADYLQIVTTKPDAIVPLEFVYDYPVPDKKASVCPNAAEALRNGACPKSCKPKTSPAEYVCPMGFWGLRKVIERHLHVPGRSEATKVIASEPITGRDELSLKGSTLVGISKQVESPSDQKLIKGLKKIRKTSIKTAKNWKNWKTSISSDHPIMLVALPHASGTAADISLEIGGDTVESVFIDESYVHVESTPPPLTVLLGCDTANTADTSAYLSHVGVFREADAAIVLGTIAKVLGTHAADMAERLIQHLEAAIKAKPGRFGEVLRKAKRTAVADSLMIGLCLVAFGDADWQIIPQEE